MRKPNLLVAATILALACTPALTTISDDPEPIGRVATDGPDTTGVSEDPEPFLGVISDGPDPISGLSAISDDPDPFSSVIDEPDPFVMGWIDDGPDPCSGTAAGEGPDPIDPLVTCFFFTDAGGLIMLFTPAP